LFQDRAFKGWKKRTYFVESLMDFMPPMLLFFIIFFFIGFFVVVFFFEVIFFFVVFFFEVIFFFVVFFFIVDFFMLVFFFELIFSIFGAVFVESCAKETLQIDNANTSMSTTLKNLFIIGNLP
jgi:hypothetical protein